MNVIVIALDTAGPLDMHDADVLVVAPAVNSRLRHWLSDEDEARRKAEARADWCVERLRRQGVDARGRVGDPDPLRSIADARARRRFPLPVRSAEERVLHAA